MNLAVVYFFYGLVFVIAGVAVLTVPRKPISFKLPAGFCWLGWFCLFHGFNEWVDLLIMKGDFFNPQTLQAVNSLLLPLSFVFLLIFPLRSAAWKKSQQKWLRLAAFISTVIWLSFYAFGKDFLVSGIVARYVLCLPGAFLTALSLYKGMAASQENSPRSIGRSRRILIFALLLYGILAGLVTPQADFLLSRWINYPNFLHLLGLPVQFFRMVCAAAIALGTWGMCGFYAEKKPLQLITFLTLFIFFIELGVMFVIDYIFPPLPSILRNALVSLLLVIILYPSLFQFMALPIMLEISQHKQTAKRLASEKEHLAVTLHAIGDGVIVADAQGKITLINRIAEILTGFKAEDAAGKSLEDVFHIINQKTRELCENLVAKVLRGGEIVGLANDTVLIAKDGRERVIADSASPIRAADKTVTGVVIVFRDISEQYKAQEAIRKLSHAVEQSPNTVVITDTAGNIEYVNPKFTQLTGYTFEEVIGKNSHILKSGETPAQEYRQLWETIASGKVWAGLFHNKKKNGQLYWEAASISPLKNPQGLITHFIAVKEDVTERKRSQDRMAKLNSVLLNFGPNPRQNINQLTALCGELLEADCALYNRLENDMLSTLGKWNVPADFPLQDYANGHICTDVIQQGNDEVMVIRGLENSPYAATDRSVLRYNLKTYVGKAIKFGAEYVGSLCAVYQRDFMPGEDDKKFLNLIAFAVGIEEARRRAEENLQQSENRFRKIATTVTDFLYTVNLKDGSPAETVYGPTCVSVTGYTADEFRANKFLWLAMVPEDDRKIVFEQVNLALSGQEPKSVEHRLIRKDGTLRWVNSQLILRRSGEGSLVAYEGVLKDITERKQAEEEVQQAIAVKSEFISVVSHELRTPLTAIKESIGIVLDGSAGEINADQADFLETAKRNVDRLARLINDVLDYQKLEAGKMAYIEKNNNINELILELHDTMQPLAKEKKVALRLESDLTLPKIKFDRDRIAQVLANLLNNALKFTDKGQIIICTKRDGNMLVVSVKDSGIGIKPEDTDKLFHTFSQIATGKDRKMGSTGLGLAISKKIIQQHRGKIWVESEFGRGSIFFFSLPIEEDRAI